MCLFSFFSCHVFFLRRDWAYLPCDRDTAYATINYKEFFAELSVTYLSSGYDDHGDDNNNNMILDENCHLLSMHDLSPPFESPEVLNRMDQDQRCCSSSSKNEKESGNKRNVISAFCNNLLIILRLQSWKMNKGHCNKFFPFTKKQLKSFDYNTFILIDQIWNEIKEWKDPFAYKPCCWRILNFCFKNKRIDNENGLEERLINNNNVISIPHHSTRNINETFPDSVDL